MVPSVPHLILRTDHGERYLPLVNGSCWTIGRNEESHVVISDRWISRNHAMLQSMDSGEYYLIDLGSRNGTFVNGRRVTIPVVLKHGDRITFGQTDLDFYSPVRAPQDLDDYMALSEEADHTATATLHERKLISVLVMDIRNFTGLTRQMDERQLSEMIGSWFREAGHIIQEYGSNVDKYIGDAVMAVWIHRTSEPEGQEVIHICKALRELWRMTESVQKQFSPPFPLRVGVGVNTGYAMVGNTGTSDRPDYTPLGDTVNAAFRLETSTKEIRQDIALGEVTYAWLLKTLGDRSTPFGQYQVHLKGYEKPTMTYACSFLALEDFLASSVQ